MKDSLPQDVTRYLGLGLQLAVTILLGVFIGYFLDKKFNCIPWLTLTGGALGLTAGFVNLFVQLKNGNGNGT